MGKGSVQIRKHIDEERERLDMNIASNGAGCAIDALLNSHLLVHSAFKALRVLLEPDRFAATLRY